MDTLEEGDEPSFYTVCLLSSIPAIGFLWKNKLEKQKQLQFINDIRILQMNILILNGELNKTNDIRRIEELKVALDRAYAYIIQFRQAFHAIYGYYPNV